MSGPYDLIVCSSVCSFLPDYPATVQQLSSMLATGGRFVQWDWERESEADEHGLTRDEVAGALAAAGLRAVEVRTAFSLEFEGMTMAPLLGTGTA